jgi:hypothetical protein
MIEVRGNRSKRASQPVGAMFAAANPQHHRRRNVSAHSFKLREYPAAALHFQHSP